MRYLITGTGRCGTRFSAALLNKLNVKCTHEGIFNPTNCGADALEIWNQADHSESSWLAVPYIERIENSPGVKITHVCRDPVKVAQSLARIDFFNHPIHKPYRDWAYLIVPDLPHYSLADQIYMFLLTVYRRLYKYPVFRVDQATPEIVADTFGVSKELAKKALKKVPKDTNSRPLPTPAWFDPKRYEELESLL